ncbi:MAG: hypothetical protein K6T34_11325 [Thermoflavifilum sp.]|nr:hypothetical protein [Thermoflavifilum sp.]
MQKDVLDAVISSQTRLKLLLRLFLNPASSGYLRGIAQEFHRSTNAIRLELNRFEQAGILLVETQGNKKMYRANTKHPLYADLRSILLKYVGLDRVISEVVERLNQVEQVYLTGDYALGRDSGIIDLIFIGEIDKAHVMKLIDRVEQLIRRKIRFLSYAASEWRSQYGHSPDQQQYLLLWQKAEAK